MDATNANQEPTNEPGLNPLILSQLAAIAGVDQAVESWRSAGRNMAAFWNALVGEGVPLMCATEIVESAVVALIENTTP